MRSGVGLYGGVRVEVLVHVGDLAVLHGEHVNEVARKLAPCRLHVPSIVSQHRDLISVRQKLLRFKFIRALQSGQRREKLGDLIPASPLSEDRDKFFRTGRNQPTSSDM